MVWLGAEHSSLLSSSHPPRLILSLLVRTQTGMPSPVFRTAYNDLAVGVEDPMSEMIADEMVRAKNDEKVLEYLTQDALVEHL